LKVKEEHKVGSKERERKQNETPIKKSLFDYKGNSKHKITDLSQKKNNLNTTATFQPT